MEVQGTLTLKFLVAVASDRGDERDIGECLDVLENYNLENDVEVAVREQVSAVNRANVYLVLLDRKFELNRNEEFAIEKRQEDLWETAWEAITSTTKN